MNRGVAPELLHCTDMAVLERQRPRMRWQQEQQQRQQQQQNEESYFSELSGVFSLPSQNGFEGGGSGFLGGGDSVLENGWPDLGNIVVSGSYGFGPSGGGFEVNYGISRTASCPPADAAAEVKGKESVILTEKMSAAVGRGSFKKRKVDKVQNTKVCAEDDTRGKRMKGCAEEGDSKITDQDNNNKSSGNNKKKSNSNNNRGTSGDTSKENSKVSEYQKPDYIHVRARRGQATDSHSLAERVRREKISERMKYLQDLVPGCNKITGKAGMLDEIINYVQSLQRQVEFLSMKLAAVNPRIDFNIDNFFAKEVFPACPGNLPAIGISSELTNPAAYLQYNQIQQMVSCSGLETGMNHSDMVLRRTICPPVSIPETFFDASCFALQPSSICDADLQNLYNLTFDQGRSSTTFFPSQPFTGSIEAGNHLKKEM